MRVLGGGRNKRGASQACSYQDITWMGVIRATKR